MPWMAEAVPNMMSLAVLTLELSNRLTAFVTCAALWGHLEDPALLAFWGVSC